MYHFPNAFDRPLEPPEDTRMIYALCVICGEEIRDRDGCYEFPDIGCICERCGKDYHKCEVTVD